MFEVAIETSFFVYQGVDCMFFFFPLQIVKLAVYGMLPKNLHRRSMMQRLHIFPEDVSSSLGAVTLCF